MNIALVEDNKMNANIVRNLLSDFGQKNGLSLSIEYFSEGRTFLENFEKYRYSIIFMDIFMGDMNGVDAAQQVRESDQQCLLIFLTSSDGFMPQAFSLHAFEYIQKPASKERIFHVLSDALSVLPSVSRSLKFSCSRQTIRILYCDIVCVESNGHNTNITDSHGNVFSPYISFSELIKPLTDDRRFLLVNKGILVNMDYILKFENKVCLLAGNISLPVRIREHNRIEQCWLDYTFDQIHAGLSQRRYNT